jgi:hypothetical protein
MILWVSDAFSYCYAECHYAECHFAECHSDECHYAQCLGTCSTTVPLPLATKRHNLQPQKVLYLRSQ